MKKIDAALAAQKIISQMKEIEILHAKISESEPIKDLLTSFLNKWNTEPQILASFNDGKYHFMIEVNAFFIRGHVKSRDGWKTLFPIFKP